MTNTALGFPAVDGRPVTQAHADLCAARGHATHKVNGVATGVCPRCGDVTAPANGTDAALDATFADLYRAETNAGHHRVTAECGMFAWDRQNARVAHAVALAEVERIWATLSLTELRQYGEYRKARR